MTAPVPPTPDRSRQEFALGEALSLLERTPRALDAMLRGLPAAWTDANEGGDTWSAFDVLGHLIHGEQTDWMPRASLILEHGDSRAFEPFDRHAQVGASAGKTPSDLLDEFARRRATNLADLEALGLQDADLDRPGRHPELGAVTLRQLLATWVAHDMDHVMQIARVLARQYSDAVGPWRAYLRVISDTQG
jgi:hypothetical protein